MAFETIEDAQEQIMQRRRDRFKVLLRTYELTDGNPRELVALTQLQEASGLDADRFHNALSSLEEGRFVRAELRGVDALLREWPTPYDDERAAAALTDVGQGVLEVMFMEPDRPIDILGAIGDVFPPAED